MSLEIPHNVVAVCLCKIRGENLLLCETMIFDGGQPAVDTMLRRAALAGKVGPIGETGDFWADLFDASGDLVETIALDRGSWNSLKNHWMRCKHVVV